MAPLPHTCQSVKSAHKVGKVGWLHKLSNSGQQLEAILQPDFDCVVSIQRKVEGRCLASGNAQWENLDFLQFNGAWYCGWFIAGRAGVFTTPFSEAESRWDVRANKV